MIIKSLCHYENDLELRWINGLHYFGEKGLRIVAQFFDHLKRETILKDFPIGTMPFLVPGLVVSRGEVQAVRNTGKQCRLTLPDLSDAEEIDVMDAITRIHYDLDGHRGGKQRILRYHVGDTPFLIPTFEYIRFMFLHSRGLAEALLQPSGLLNYAVTPNPGLYTEIQIDFTEQMPHKVITPEFVREFAWLSVHPDGRRAWDSVRLRSQGKRFLSFDPPGLRESHFVFRGVEWDRRWLVLEILSISGRVLPAETIFWTHPSERERIVAGSASEYKHPEVEAFGEIRPRHVRECVVDSDVESRKNRNQDAILLGGKRGCFDNNASVVKLLRPRKSSGPGGTGQGQVTTRKPRSDAGQMVNPNLPPEVVRQAVSVGDLALAGGLPPVDFILLEKAEEDHIGELNLLDEVLRRIEAVHSDLTLTRHLVFLKRGKAISFCGSRRRACLVAVFTSSRRPPRVLLDVDHGKLNGLAGLLLRYDADCPIVEMGRHIKLILDAVVDNHGHWKRLVEKQLPEFVTVKRLPKLLRMTDRYADEDYVGKWMRKISNDIARGFRKNRVYADGADKINKPYVDQ